MEEYAATSNREEGIRIVILRELNGLFDAANSRQHISSVIYRTEYSKTHELSLGSTLVFENTVNSTPSRLNPSTTWLIASNLETLPSVTTQTRFAPRFLKSIPTSLVQPGPNRILDAAISKAYSLLEEEEELATGVASERRPVCPGMSLLAWQGQFEGTVYWIALSRFVDLVAAVLASLMCEEDNVMTDDYSIVFFWRCRASKIESRVFDFFH